MAIKLKILSAPTPTAPKVATTPKTPTVSDIIASRNKSAKKIGFTPATTPSTTPSTAPTLSQTLASRNNSASKIGTGVATSPLGSTPSMVTNATDTTPSRDATGNLTDYGKHLQTQQEAANIRSTYKTPEAFNADLGLYGGLAPTYEQYVVSSGDNQVMSRDQWNNRSQYNTQNTGGDRYNPAVQGGIVPLSSYAGGTTGATGLTGYINSATQAATDAIAMALKQKLASIPATYDPLRASSEVAKASELRSVLEQNANVGDTGGIGRQAALETQTAGENRLQGYNIAQQADILSAQTAADQANAEVQQNATEQMIQATQYQQSLAEQIASRQANDKATADALKYKQEQDVIQSQIDADTLEYNRARQAEQDAQDLWYKQQQVKAKTAAQKLAEKKAKDAYNIAKAKTATANAKLQNSVRKKGSSSSKGSSGSSGTKTDSSGLSIFE